MGSGAMACFFAARLSASSVPVTLLSAWEEGISALKQKGVRLEDDSGQGVSYPVKAANRPEDVEKHALALVLEKSWQTRSAAEMLSRCLDTHGIALTLQNGLGNQELIAAVLGAHRTLCGSTTFGAQLVEPGRVRSTGTGEILLPRCPSSRPFERLFTACGIPVQIYSNLDGVLWGKLIVNAAINPLTALLDVPNGYLLANNDAHHLLQDLILECSRVTSAGNIPLPWPDPVAYVEMVIKNTSTNSSSMRQDLKRGTLTEIDAITGQMIAHGAQWGVETPLNSLLYRLIKARSALFC